MSIGIVACGALTTHIKHVQERFNLDLTIYSLPPLLHNSPRQIAGQVDSLLKEIKSEHSKCAVAYADCGTYGALDEVLLRHGVSRLGGNHCYDVFAGINEIKALSAAIPGTYFLTDFLVKSFHRSVEVELGLDKRPELREDYFRHYESTVWLAQNPTDELEREALKAAEIMGLPLTIRYVGEEKLAKEVLRLIAD